MILEVEVELLLIRIIIGIFLMVFGRCDSGFDSGLVV